MDVREIFFWRDKEHAWESVLHIEQPKQAQEHVTNTFSPVT